MGGQSIPYLPSDGRASFPFGDFKGILNAIDIYIILNLNVYFNKFMAKFYKIIFTVKSFGKKKPV